MKKLIIIIVVFTLITVGLALKNVSYEQPNIFENGEELIYKVKWSFIRVGTLKLVNKGLVDYKDGQYYKLMIYIDSASGLPFVTIHDVYESYVDSNAVPVAFYAREDKGDHTVKTEYTFDYENKVANVKVSKDYPDRIEITSMKKVPLDQVYRDVLSLLFYARQMSGEKQTDISIPTFVLEGPDTCYFNQAGKLDRVEVNGENRASYYLEGKVKFIGIAGIKDDFEGWFSVDSQRVPLKAKMKAFFGSVTIELEESTNWLASSR